MNQRTIYSGMQVLLNQAWQCDKAVVVEDGVIVAIVSQHEVSDYLPAEKVEYAQDYYLVPGFIDCHIHGAGGCDVMDASVDALTTISTCLAKEGVTSFLATTMTATSDDIIAALQVIPKAQAQQQGAEILGVHLEGPFISKEKMGAQLGEKVCEPDIGLFHQWQTASGNTIKLVTLAPEVHNAAAFIQEVTQQGVIASMGHSDATYEQANHAVMHGCTHATHLFNAMRGLHHREPGVVGAALLADTVTAELIADGEHLHPAIYPLALRMKGRENIVLVTDAIRAKCMPDGTYDLGGQEVAVTNSKVTLADGTLAGSVLTMPQAIKNMMQFTGCSLADAVAMASYNPAHQLKVDDRKGTIEVGKDADLVVLDAELNVQLTVCRGAAVGGTSAAVIASE